MSINFRKVDKNLIEALRNFSFDRQIKIMEVCGTHTVSIHKYGVHKILHKSVKLISGPGCPVCVTPHTYIDEAVFLARQGFIIATFGDMIKVPGGISSLGKERADGYDLKVVYSPLDAVTLAEKSDKEVVFLAVGFETTVPGIAVAVKMAKDKGLANFSILPGNKIIPNAMTALIQGETDISGFLLPGHVSTVIGVKGYDFMKPFNIPGVIAGFEPLDLVTSILVLLQLIKDGKSDIVNNYKRIVRDEGNEKSLSAIYEVFEEADSEWRGLGTIPLSGLKLKEKYSNFDVRKKVNIKIEKTKPNPACRCGDVLKGLIDPPECKLFKKVCHPDNPVGPCMVSSEGSCAAWYWYG